MHHSRALLKPVGIEINRKRVGKVGMGMRNVIRGKKPGVYINLQFPNNKDQRKVTSTSRQLYQTRIYVAITIALQIVYNESAQRKRKHGLTI